MQAGKLQQQCFTVDCMLSWMAACGLQPMRQLQPAQLSHCRARPAHACTLPMLHTLPQALLPLGRQHLGGSIVVAWFGLGLGAALLLTSDVMQVGGVPGCAEL